MKRLIAAWCVVFLAAPLSAAPPSYVDITWMSISNMFYEIGPLGIVTDGYVTRIPENLFFGGGGGLASTKAAVVPDAKAVGRVLAALGGGSKVNLLLTGHSHFDHSFDTGTWSKLTSAPIIGSRTTCLQVQAEKVPVDRCRAVNGREVIQLADGVTLRVVRWNHSGDPNVNPEQHNPVELRAIPVPDAASGGLHAGVAEDFPNGGGVRAFLFTVDAPEGRLSWFFQNSASAVDLNVPIVIDGVDYGAPLDNLKAAMKDAGLESVDLWIGSGGRAIAALVAPVVKPKAYLPVHWDGLYGAFEKGVPRAYSDPGLEAFLQSSGILLVRPVQYMDKWRLDRKGVHVIDNAVVKKSLGF
jgi:hypothetical protein